MNDYDSIKKTNTIAVYLLIPIRFLDLTINSKDFSAFALLIPKDFKKIVKSFYYSLQNQLN